MPESRAPARSRSRVAAAAGPLLAASLLAGCASGAFTSPTQRTSYEPANDACRPQVMALDSTGAFFGQKILAAAGNSALQALTSWRPGEDLQSTLASAVTQAANAGISGYWDELQQHQANPAALTEDVSNGLASENAHIDSTQAAFNGLIDCRYREAAEVRADYRAGRISRTEAEQRMAGLRELARQDLALAQLINQRIQGRGAQFAYATEQLGAPPPRHVSARHARVLRSAAIKLTPDPDAPEVGHLRPHERVRVTGGTGRYALVETADGTSGYAAMRDLTGPGAHSARTASAQSRRNGGSVATLSGSNAARRDAFAQSVKIAQSAQASGFQLSG